MYVDKMTVASRKVIVNNDVHPLATLPELKVEYTRIFIVFTPFLFFNIWNYLVNKYVIKWIRSKISHMCTDTHLNILA